jgi:hypothetical protein
MGVGRGRCIPDRHPMGPVSVSPGPGRRGRRSRWAPRPPAASRRRSAPPRAAWRSPRTVAHDAFKLLLERQRRGRRGGRLDNNNDHRRWRGRLRPATQCQSQRVDRGRVLRLAALGVLRHPYRWDVGRRRAVPARGTGCVHAVGGQTVDPGLPAAGPTTVVGHLPRPVSATGLALPPGQPPATPDCRSRRHRRRHRHSGGPPD